MKKPKWLGCLLPIVVGCLLIPAYLATHLSSFPLLSPDLAEEYNHRGVAKFELGDKQGAISDYNRAVTIDSEDAFAYYNRGVAKFELGDKQGAILDFDRALATAILVFIPLSCVAKYQHWGDLSVFATSALAIIPLSIVLGTATLKIAM